MSQIVDLIAEWAENSEANVRCVGGYILDSSEETREQIERYAPAILGVTDGYWTTSEYNDRIAVIYDENKIIEIIAEDMEPMGDDPKDLDDEYNDPLFLAREYFDFNIKGAWEGEYTPIYINTFSWEIKLEEKINESNNR